MYRWYLSVKRTAVVLNGLLFGLALSSAPATAHTGDHTIGEMHGWLGGWLHFPIGLALLLIAVAAVVVFIRSLLPSRKFGTSKIELGERLDASETGRRRKRGLIRRRRH